MMKVMFNIIKYSDYYSLFSDNTSIYINLAKSFILDKDGGEQRPFRYWRIIKGY